MDEMRQLYPLDPRRLAALDPALIRSALSSKGHVHVRVAITIQLMLDIAMI